MAPNSDFLNRDRPAYTKVLGHLTCWAVFIGYELVILYQINGHLEAPFVYLVYYSINILFFYAQVALWNATFYHRKFTYPIGAGLFAMLICLNLGLKYTADQLLDTAGPPIEHSLIYFRNFLVRNIVRTFYFSMLAAFYWFSGYMAYARTRKIEAERKQLSAEREKVALDAALQRSRNAYLQQQINPHMLLNALNFVFSTVQPHSQEAAHCIWLLSEIMRFSLEEAGTDGKIVLSREIEQLENLITINRYRFREPLALTVNSSGDFSALRIIPLIVLTLAENIFKHGDLTDQAQPGLLSVSANEAGKFTFYSRNLKKSKNGHPRREPLGLQNIRIRLDSAYAESYELSTREYGDIYELTLHLNLCA